MKIWTDLTCLMALFTAAPVEVMETFPQQMFEVNEKTFRSF